MIAKIKLIYAGETRFIFKRNIDWNLVGFQFMLQPQVGTTVIIPQGSKESFRFYIGHIVADLRTGDTVLVERRDFNSGHPLINDGSEDEMIELSKQLRIWGWEEEK